MPWITRPLFPLLACTLLFILSCAKESFTGSPALSLYASADTVRFDTVLSATSSPTQAVKLFNPNRQGVRIRRIALAGGAASPFRLVADGQAGAEVLNTELGGGDSTYLFLQVRPPQGPTPLPFELADSVVVEWESGRLSIPLRAWGQAARILRGHRVSGREVWTAGLPVLILDSLVIPAGTELVLPMGGRIYVHGVTPIRVEGTLTAVGGPDSADRILFATDRLDAPYRDFPGAWNGLTVAPAGRLQLNYATLAGARTAIDLLEGARATLEGVILSEASVAGLRSDGGTVEARNLLIANCGAGLVLQGGTYAVEHLTVAAGGHRYVAHKEPLLQASARNAPLQGFFRNAIFWGPDGGGLVPQEVRIEGGTSLSLLFEGVAWRAGPLPPGVQTAGTVLNGIEPGFVEPDGTRPSFRLRPGAPAADAGSATTLRTDLDGKPRPVRAPDLGAYERE